MCCGGKCLFFIPVRTGSLIFGYIIAVISAFGTIACTGFILYFGITLMFPPSFYEYNSYNNDNYNSYDRQALFLARTSAAVLIVAGFLLEFLSSFVSSVLLLVGITKNKPSLVKSFIIYGMVQVVLLYVFFIILHCVTSFFYAGFLFLALAFEGLYLLCVYMVFLTYQSMAGGLVFMNPPANAVF